MYNSRPRGVPPLRRGPFIRDESDVRLEPVEPQVHEAWPAEGDDAPDAAGRDPELACPCPCRSRIAGLPDVRSVPTPVRASDQCCCCGR